MIVILYNIRSSHNVGSIFRTADAAGIKKIYCCGITPGPLDRFDRPNQRLTKVSLGAEKYVAWEKRKSVTRLVDRLKKQGYQILAVEQDKNSMSLFDIVLSPERSRRQKSKLCQNLSFSFDSAQDKLAREINFDKVALVLGNEIRGLPPSILKRADKIIEIPMAGKKESLNVAVAFGIVTFQLIR